MSTAPAHIRQLARQAIDPLRDDLGSPRSSPSIDREVVADWCEAHGLQGYATYLRPRPAAAAIGIDVWHGMRRNILRWLAGEGASSPSQPSGTDSEEEWHGCDERDRDPDR